MGTVPDAERGGFSAPSGLDLFSAAEIDLASGWLVVAGDDSGRGSTHRAVVTEQVDNFVLAADPLRDLTRRRTADVFNLEPIGCHEPVPSERALSSHGRKGRVIVVGTKTARIAPSLFERRLRAARKSVQLLSGQPDSADAFIARRATGPMPSRRADEARAGVGRADRRKPYFCQANLLMGI